MRFSLLALIGLTASCLAFGPPQTAGPTVLERSIALLRTPEVQKEVKASPTQMKAIEAAYAKSMKAVQDAIRANQATKNEAAVRAVDAQEQKKLAATCIQILTTPQKDRLKELFYQLIGAFGLTIPEIASSLSVDSAQTKRIESIWKSFAAKGRAITDERARQVRAIPRPKNENDKASMEAYNKQVFAFVKSHEAGDRKTFESLKKQAEAQILAVLKPQQRTKWTSMQGKKFTFPKPKAPSAGK